VLIATALAMGVAKWHFHEPHSAYRTLPEVLASGKYEGFDLVHEPDRPGPYQDMGATGAGKGESLSGSFWLTARLASFMFLACPARSFASSVLFPKTAASRPMLS
jgi:hypothetical protein